MPKAEETRTIEIKMDIDAAVGRVWNALTDPEQLRQWFPLMAEVDGGAGGAIRLTWGPDLDGRNAIIAWEPDRYLKTGWFNEPEGDAPLPEQATRAFHADAEARKNLAVEFFLQSKGDDQTFLRMVHSGFRTAKEWDEEYDAHSRGWIWELTSLANYLGHHDGKERHVAWVRQPLAVPKAEAWSVLASPQALLAEGSLDGLRPGDQYAITTVHGDRFEGRVLLNQPPTEFAGTVDNMNHSMLRFGIETYLRHPEASFWLSIWGDPARAEAFRARWRQTFDRLLG
jgi:uncharacterized protein YndB with AHSA1/START domain